MYLLEEYKGFLITISPFFTSALKVEAVLENPNMLQTLLGESLRYQLFDDTETAWHNSLETCAKNVKEAVDKLVEDYSKICKEIIAIVM